MVGRYERAISRGRAYKATDAPKLWQEIERGQSIEADVSNESIHQEHRMQQDVVTR